MSQFGGHELGRIAFCSRRVGWADKNNVGVAQSG